ncbi:hypothetical protein BS17DRAFT_88349 [Gyrodon lividus]|nr:hypothetical protein BS17DRAFT_88349 [Gyrodon lividus]
MVFSSGFTHAFFHLAAFVNIFVTFYVRGSAGMPLAGPSTNASFDLRPNQDIGWERRTTPAAPHFVIYSDKWISSENGPPAVTDIQVCHSLHSLRI